MLNTLTTIICALPVVYQFIEMVTAKTKKLPKEKFDTTLKYRVQYQKFFLLAMGAFGLAGVIMTARFGMEKAATPRMVISCIIAVIFIKFLMMKSWRIEIEKDGIEVISLFGKKSIPYSEIDSLKCEENKKTIYSSGKKVATIADTVIGFNEVMKVLKRKKVRIDY
ncbi:DUF6560 family protein [Peptacetobacter sp.]|uniref:DUF6560 family protein n=1 Tax=unclassified Peptacetobacter TaxID=2991974 RepID=UPI00260C0522|nr:DUF6560 family protein [Peptacetobacter sp.]MEE0451402.1 DUF6560 family protein [Peptacetobacter sp.]